MTDRFEPHPGRAAVALETAHIGQRLWFWMCPEVGLGSQRLLLTDMIADPKMDRLEQAVRLIRRPLGGRLYRGFATVGATGALQLGAPGLAEDLLPPLAEWALAHLEENPALARMKNLSLVSLSQQGRVEAHHRNADLWRAFPDHPLPGTPRAAGQLLDALQTEENALYWMTDRGTANRPAIALTLQAEDPKGERLAELVRSLAGPGRRVQGVLRALSNGGLALTTLSEVDAVESVLAEVYAAYPSALAMLSEATIVRLENHRLADSKLAALGQNLRVQCGVLESLQPGDTAFFSFTDVYGRTGKPLLFLASRRDELLSVAAEAKDEGREIRGRLRLSDKGYCLFIAKKPFGRFLPALATWVREYREQWPALDRLLDARLVIQDAGGQIAERFRDDDLWDSVRTQ